MLCSEPDARSAGSPSRWKEIPILKRIILLRRRPGLTRAEMLHYWQHTHAPLAMQYPEWFESTQRYTQNHLGGQLAGAPFDFDGMVESWQRPAGAVGRSFPDTEAYRTVVGPDERMFVDRASSLLFFVNEQVLAPRVAPAKVLTFVARSPGIAADDFASRWLQKGDVCAGGHVRNLVVPGSMRVIGAPDAPLPFTIDGIEERRYGSEGEAAKAIAAEHGRQARGAGPAQALATIIAREVTLYDRDLAARQQ
ncbi:MAG: hypothetical protein FJY55_12225 [Betaproteobacteria bacterium]|nr:hypothetical protein [Betaproteobacteria bacterium]